jgi:hypothetical protein
MVTGTLYRRPCGTNWGCRRKESGFDRFPALYVGLEDDSSERNGLSALEAHLTILLVGELAVHCADVKMRISSVNSSVVGLLWVLCLLGSQFDTLLLQVFGEVGRRKRRWTFRTGVYCRKQLAAAATRRFENRSYL